MIYFCVVVIGWDLYRACSLLWFDHFMDKFVYLQNRLECLGLKSPWISSWRKTDIRPLTIKNHNYLTYTKFWIQNKKWIHKLRIHILASCTNAHCRLSLYLGQHLNYQSNGPCHLDSKLYRLLQLCDSVCDILLGWNIHHNLLKSHDPSPLIQIYPTIMVPIYMTLIIYIDNIYVNHHPQPPILKLKKKKPTSQTRQKIKPPRLSEN